MTLVSVKLCRLVHKRELQTYDDSEINPISKTCRQNNSEFHNIKDGPSEVGDEFEELVFVWAEFRSVPIYYGQKDMRPTQMNDLRFKLVPARMLPTFFNLRRGKTLLSVGIEPVWRHL